MSEEYVWRINDDGTDAKIQKVVRCKDCKWWKKFEQPILPEICSRCGANMTADDFCSRGELK